MAGRYVSTKLRQSARGKDCTLRLDCCSFNPEETVACHINTPYKGTGIKSPDLFMIYGCYNCHAEIDKNQKKYAQDILRALIETQYSFLEDELISLP